MENELRDKSRRLYPLFAEMLGYPDYSLYECFDECISLLMGWHREAAKLLRKFESILARVPLTEMQEIYTRTFDLQPACYPYVGYHLFGENYRRELFMAGLKKRYHTHGFSPGKELPDHLPVILRFLAEPSRDDRNDELIHECVIPSLQKMLAEGLKEEDDPYRGVMQALLLTLQKEGAQSLSHGAKNHQIPLALSA